MSWEVYLLVATVTHQPTYIESKAVVFDCSVQSFSTDRKLKVLLYIEARLTEFIQRRLTLGYLSVRDWCLSVRHALCHRCTCLLAGVLCKKQQQMFLFSCFPVHRPVTKGGGKGGRACALLHKHNSGNNSSSCFGILSRQLPTYKQHIIIAVFTSSSAMAEGPCDTLVSRNSVTTKHPI